MEVVNVFQAYYPLGILNLLARMEMINGALAKECGEKDLTLH